MASRAQVSWIGCSDPIDAETREAPVCWLVAPVDCPRDLMPNGERCQSELDALSLLSVTASGIRCFVPANLAESCSDLLRAGAKRRTAYRSTRRDPSHVMGLYRSIAFPLASCAHDKSTDPYPQNATVRPYASVSTAMQDSGFEDTNDSRFEVLANGSPSTH